MPEGIAAALLVAVLIFAVVRPWRLPEAVAAVPAAGLLLAFGIITPDQAWSQIGELAPTIAFLAGILMLAHLAQAEGVFAAAGHLMARQSHLCPTRLLALVFLIASVTSAVLSLDATVVLLTPVVFATASRLGARPKPHVYATTHLANSASLLLPVSNLTNLLAFGATGLTFAAFAGLMTAPWLAAIAVEFVVFRWYFARDLSVVASPREDPEPPAIPLFALIVLGLTLVGFAASSLVHIAPFWVALAGAAVLAAKRLITQPASRRSELGQLASAANPWFLVFVLSLAIVVQAVVEHGVGDAMRVILPTHNDVGGLLVLALIGALLANVVNNLPAVLVLTPLVAPLGPVAILAVLIGVNIGPNLTYVGSLATLLWRRIMADHDHDAEITEFTKLGLLTVPLSVVLSTIALWASALLMGV